MKNAIVLALTIYGIAAVIAMLVAVLIKVLFVAVRRFSR
jgi:hypothetical protein